jgi:S-(hydroxymethyl)glutathione dehydrogenase / alcohol dehydrogenase
MQAAIAFEPQGNVTVEEVELSKPGPDEVLVRIMASGVCHSDWHILKGEWGDRFFPVILGHEGAGIVEAVGEGVVTPKVGDHVILSWRTSCGMCEMCQKGWPVLCDRSPAVASKPTLKTGRPESPLGLAGGLGTFAEYALVHETAAVVIDPDIPFEQASLVGCGVTTGVGAAINTAGVVPGATCAVFGCGGVGLNVIQGCRIAGASQIIAVDMLDNKLDMAKRFGATDTVNASQVDPVEAIKELTGGPGVHYAFEAIGLVEAPFLQSIQCTRKRGVTIWVGHAPLNTNVNIDARTIMQEKTVMGSMYGSARPQIEFPRLLRLYQEGKLMLDELITRSFPLSGANEAFAALGRGEVARSVLQLA